MGGVGECYSADAVLFCEFHGAGHGGVGGEVSGAEVSGPALERAEVGDCLRRGGGVDAADADHLCKTRKTRDAVGGDAVEVGFSGEAGGECGAVAGDAERSEGALDGVAELVEGNEHKGNGHQN
jgi:hypothetical protein